MLFVFVLWMISIAASAQTSTATDSVCAGSSDVVYGITSPNSGSSFEWGFKPGSTSLGTIDNTVSSDNSTIQIDWGTTTGTTTIYAVETSADGCIADTVYLDIVINELPTIAITSDAVCLADTNSVELTLTGQAPWAVELSDGTTTTSYNITSSPATVSLPSAFATSGSYTISVVSLTDANDCAQTTGLPTASATVYPKPSTGAIFHY